MFAFIMSSISLISNYFILGFALTLLVIFPFANASIYPVQPNAFTAIAMNGDGTYIVACTSTQWFYYTDLTGWLLGTVSTGLSGMLGVGLSAETTVSKTITFAGTDGFRAYYDGNVPAAGAFPPIATTGITSARSLSISGTDATVYQIMGTLDGGVWVSRATSTGFVKYVRVGPNAGAGEPMYPIGAVSARSNTFGAISVNYNRAYTSTTGDFTATAKVPIAGYRYMTDMAMLNANVWYATFAGNEVDTALQMTTNVESSDWVPYLNNTLFHQAQAIAISSGVNAQALYTFVILASDKVLVSGDSGVNYDYASGVLDPATGLPSQYTRASPLDVAVNSDGTRISFITRLGIYVGVNCGYSTGGKFTGCTWSSVSIETSTSTYIAQNSAGAISGRNGGIEFKSENGGLSWDVSLIKTDL